MNHLSGLLSPGHLWIFRVSVDHRKVFLLSNFCLLHVPTLCARDGSLLFSLNWHITDPVPTSPSCCLWVSRLQVELLLVSALPSVDNCPQALLGEWGGQSVVLPPIPSILRKKKFLFETRFHYVAQPDGLVLSILLSQLSKNWNCTGLCTVKPFNICSAPCHSFNINLPDDQWIGHSHM